MSTHKAAQVPQAVSVAAPNIQSVVTSTVPVTHSKFAAFMGVLAALEPVILAGVSPFIKNEHSQQIVATEAPLAQTLMDALSKL